MAGTCGKLVMLTASAAERTTLATSNREEFDFRVDVCVKSTVHRVHAQPEFSNPKIVAALCKPDTLPLYSQLCRRAKLSAALEKSK